MPIWSYDVPTLFFDSIDAATDDYYTRINKQLLANDLIFLASFYAWSGASNATHIKTTINDIDLEEQRVSFTYEMKYPSSNNKAIYVNVPMSLRSFDALLGFGPSGVEMGSGTLPDEY
ncbi:MAG: hypothetical protein MJ201_01325 [Mycoplasmoidaceae bacterium]|nr:hypothetical protein [Mycoplasmoidaceae bacterium]